MAGLKNRGNYSGSVSPGFIYYDAVNNVYYGYKGVYQKPETYETIIIPDVLSSSATKRMRTTIPTFLSTKNIGWGLINDISSSRIKGKYASIYKRISMEHYLHCIQQRITNGDFD